MLKKRKAENAVQEESETATVAKRVKRGDEEEDGTENSHEVK